MLILKLSAFIFLAWIFPHFQRDWLVPRLRKLRETGLCPVPSAFSRTVARPLLVKINCSNHLSFIIALRKYNANALVVARCALKSVGRTGTITNVTLSVVDLTISHDLFHFLLADLPARHSATRMLRVFQERSSSIKSPVAVDLFIRGCRFTGVDV